MDPEFQTVWQMADEEVMEGWETAKATDLVFVHSNLRALLKYREELKVEEYIGWEDHSSPSSTSEASSDGANELEDAAQTCPNPE